MNYFGINFLGILLGFVSFVIIGVFHPLVIKAEYYFGKKSWIGFLVFGIIFSVLSTQFDQVLISTSLGVLGFSCFWSIMEVFDQVKRVEKGLFPKNPKREYK